MLFSPSLLPSSLSFPSSFFFVLFPFTTSIHSLHPSRPLQISWIRRRDWHVLTSGVYTYTNDERFSITHRDGADDWTLSIKYLQERDNGTYECHVSVQ